MASIGLDNLNSNKQAGLAGSISGYAPAESQTGLAGVISSYGEPAPTQAPQYESRITANGDVQRFVEEVMPQAERVAQRLRVPVEAVIGQWGLETGWGKSVIPGTNNLGNIKGKGVAATDNATKSRDEYRAYADLDQFADDFGNLLGNGRYRGVSGAKDAQSYFAALKQGGYAEDPAYVAKGAKAADMVRSVLPKPQQPQDTAPALTWTDVTKKPGFTDLSPEEVEQLRGAYFDQYVRPAVGDEARDAFMAESKKLDPARPGFLERMAGKVFGNKPASVMDSYVPPDASTGKTGFAPMREDAYNKARADLLKQTDAQLQQIAAGEDMTARIAQQVLQERGAPGVQTQLRNLQLGGKPRAPVNEFADIVRQNGPVVEPAKPEGMEVFTNAVMRGIKNNSAMISGLAAAGFKAFGADDLSLRMLKESLKSQGEAAQYPAQIKDFTEIGGWRDVPTYVLEGLVENAPQLIGSIGGGVAGGMLAKKFGKDAVAGMVREAAQRELSKRVATGAALGAGAASVGMETGSIYTDIAKETGEQRPGVAFGFGLAAGALDAIPAFRAARGVLGDAATREIADTVIKRYGKEALTQLGAEGSTEFLQTLIEKGAVSYVDGRPVLTKENLIEAIDAGLKGGLAGATTGTAVQGYQDLSRAAERRRQEQAPVSPDGRLEPTMQGDVPPIVDANEPGLHNAGSVADEIVREAAQTAGMNADSLLPQQTNDDAVMYADMRREQLIEKRDGGFDPDTGEPLPPVGLTPAEAEELNFLEQAGDNPAALAALYQQPQGATDEIQQEPGPASSPNPDGAQLQPGEGQAGQGAIAQGDAGNGQSAAGQQNAAVQADTPVSLPPEDAAVIEQFLDTIGESDNAVREEIMRNAATDPGIIEYARQRIGEAQRIDEMLGDPFAQQPESKVKQVAKQQKQDAAALKQDAQEQAEKAAPSNSTAPENLIPGTPEYDAYYAKKASEDEQKRKAASQERRKAESLEAVGKKNNWRTKVLSWFESAIPGDTITTDIEGEEYVVVQKTIERNGRKIVSKRLVAKGAGGDGRDIIIIESRDGKIYQGPNTKQGIDESAGFAHMPETDSDSRAATLGRLLEEGKAKSTSKTQEQTANASQPEQVAQEAPQADVPQAGVEQTAAQAGEVEAQESQAVPAVEEQKPRTEKEARALRAQQQEQTNGAQATQAEQAETQGPQTEQAGVTNAPDSTQAAEPKQATSSNTVFTDEAAEAARALLRRKLGQLNSGIDPEVLQAGITLAGWHIEKGARTFASFAKAMLNDMGEAVRPYLKSWYMGVKYDPRAAGFTGMDSAATVEEFDVTEFTRPVVDDNDYAKREALARELIDCLKG